MAGALAGVRIIELAGLGALPFGALKLGDMGAEILRIERVADVPAEPKARPPNFWDRGRRSVAIDLKQPAGVATLLRLVESAEVFLESYRPGVAERLGVGPEALWERNPALVYGRLTGWGQDGPLARVAGHSLNYEALTGVVRAIGPADVPPSPLLTVLGDFAGGGLQLAYGVVCALLEARSSGRGQVVDVAMSEGVMSLLAPFYAMRSLGLHTASRSENLFDGGSPFYNVYETADGRYVSVAPLEPHFRAVLLERLGLDPEEFADGDDRKVWPELRARLAEVFRSRSREQWCELLEGSDACFAPVLELGEVARHPQHVAREVFEAGGSMQELRPLPRLSRTPGEPLPSPDWPGVDTDAVLLEAGFAESEIAVLREAGAVA